MDFNENNDIGPLVRDILAARPPAGTGFDTALWRELGKAGVLAAALPASAGGSDLGLLGHCAVLIEVGRALAPAPYLAAIALGAQAIAEFGSAAQAERWAAPAGDGELVLSACVPLTEAGVAQAAARAEPDGPGWVLSGSFTAVPAAPWADEFIIPAGEQVFVVPRAAVQVAPQELVDGVSAGQVRIDAARVGADRLLLDCTQEWLWQRGVVGVCAHQLGVCERALELTASYATTRMAFGRPIGTFQAVSQRLADAWIDVDAIRLTMWQAAWRLGAGLPSAAEISTAKFWAADAGHRVAHTAVHVHGGVGIDVSYPLARYFAAAKHNEFYLGHATEHLRHVGTILADADDHVLARAGCSATRSSS